MTDKQLVRIKKAGEGSYGVVYLATEYIPKKNTKSKSAALNEKDITNIPEDSLYAVKRNFKEKPTTGYGNLRELNMMIALSGYPYIVNLLDVKDYDPFLETGKPMTPVPKTTFKEMNEDKMHFIMEYLPFNGEEYIEQKTCTPPAMKVIIMQLLLAVEFMHSQGIVHRDIRTSNILISVDEEGNHRLTLCDFGLSRIMGDGRSTPGTITSWYRAPEVCCACLYDKKVDIWSTGCVIYEIICGRPLLKGVDDNDTEIFGSILSKLPTAPLKTVIEKLFSRGTPLKYQPTASQYNRKTYVERMALKQPFKKQFNAVPGSLDELEDLFEKMLCLDPDNRVSATRALNHSFFNWTREHIESVRKEYPPEPSALPFYEIYPCIERTWVIALVFNIYNSRLKSYTTSIKPINMDKFSKIDKTYLPPSQEDWYNHRILFHALDLFDQYIQYCFTSGDVNLRDSETQILGRIHSKEETYLRFYVCLYMMHKYYATLEIPLDWKEFVPKIFTTVSSKKIAETFEELIVYNVTKMMIFRKTLLEISTEFVDSLTEKDVKILLNKLGNLDEEWIDGSVRALYRKFMNISNL